MTTKEKVAALREKIKANREAKPALVSPVSNPRYDKVYKDGVNWLNTL